MSNPRRPTTMILGLLCTMAAATGCGSDGDGSAGRPASEEAKASAAPSESGGSEFTDGNEPWRSDDVELGAAATGLKVALMAEDVEVEGTTIHVYLEDGARVPGGPCTVALATVPDEATVVIHQDGEETTC